jgi:alcohol/geraniol dehydrogenase (NADP+)
VNTRESKAMKETAGTQDFILTTVNADQDWAAFIQSLRPTGTLCFVGVPPSPVPLHVFPLISGLRTISGSPIGSPFLLREMLDVAARHGVMATTERFPMTKANDAIEKVKKNKVRYRAVLAN